MRRPPFLNRTPPALAPLPIPPFGIYYCLATKCRQPLSVMREHAYAVRRLRCCPHPTGVLASASYDTTVVLWDTTKLTATPPPPPPPRPRPSSVSASASFLASSVVPVLDRCVGHTEFVAGVAFSLFEPRVLATCAWDRRLCLWSA